MFLSRKRLGKSLAECPETFHGVGVAVFCGFDVPVSSRLHIFRRTNTDLRIIAHSELCTRKAFSSCFLGKGEGKRFVLLESVFCTAQEPFAEGHVSLNLSLLTSEAVILDAEKGIERERRMGKFVRMAELVLRRRKAKICGTFQVSSGFLNSICTRWYEGSKGLRGNGDMRKFAEKEKAIYVGGLRHL
jgi:hypothetical protein